MEHHVGEEEVVEGDESEPQDEKGVDTSCATGVGPGHELVYLGCV